MVGQQILNLSGEGSNPSSPTIKKKLVPSSSG